MPDDARADRLAAIAVELTCRVRDDEPAAVHRWLQAVVPDNDMMALAVILAAAVPDDRTWSELTEWTWIGEELREERFGAIPWRERYARPRPLPQVVQTPVHRLSRGSSTVALDSTDEQDAA